MNSVWSRAFFKENVLLLLSNGRFSTWETVGMENSFWTSKMTPVPVRVLLLSKESSKITVFDWSPERDTSHVVLRGRFNSDLKCKCMYSTLFFPIRGITGRKKYFNDIGKNRTFRIYLGFSLRLIPRFTILDSFLKFMNKWSSFTGRQFLVIL